MMTRDAFLKQFRAETFGTTTVETVAEEWFQNTVLRPILKLQNDLIIHALREYLIQHKINLTESAYEYKMVIIENAVFKDIPFQNILKGFVVGLFTLEEYEIYSKNRSNFNKRIRIMIIERLKNQLSVLDLQNQ